jgi:hypothetical protein
MSYRLINGHKLFNDFKTMSNPGLVFQRLGYRAIFLNAQYDRFLNLLSVKVSIELKVSMNLGK